MSYAIEVKEDILKQELDVSAKLVELEAFLRLGGEVIISNPIRLSFLSPNLHILRYMIGNVKQFYSNVVYETYSKSYQKLKNQTSYVCLIKDGAKTIIEDLSLIENSNPRKQEILENVSLQKAYLRGAFLAKGSVNDPKTSNYHLEICTDKESEAPFIQRIMNEFELNARIIRRRNHLVIYIKEKEKIVDFLRYIGANVSMNEFENIIIKRDLSANINRVLNIEVANQQKTNSSAREQLKYIHYVEMNFPKEKIDEKLQTIMKVRKENPEASLNELIPLVQKESKEMITKSGLNHRFRKIKKMALELDARRKETK